VSRKATAKQYLRMSKKRVYLPPIIAAIDNIKGSFDMRQQILREKALPTLSTRYQISAIEDEGAKCWTTSMVHKTKTSSLSPRSKDLPGYEFIHELDHVPQYTPSSKCHQPSARQPQTD
jgi:hypothetical protein